MSLDVPVPGKPARDLAFCIRLTAAALLITIALSWRLYLSEFRIFALAPLVPSLAGLPASLDRFVLIVLVSSLLWLLASPARRLPAAAALICLVFGGLQDITRLTPYIYMYGFTLLAGVFAADDKAGGLRAMRIMVCGVYFWAGFHKINVTFYSTVFPWFVSPLYGFTFKGAPPILDYLAMPVVLITPLFESLIGVLLLFPRWRKFATVMAFVMLTVVLMCLGPLGHGWGRVVWPWNVYLFLLELRLFFTADADEPFLFSRREGLARLAFAFFVVAPVLACFIPEYGYPGYKLYSGNVPAADVEFSASENWSRAPGYIRTLSLPTRRLDLVFWTEHEIGTLTYPSDNTFKIAAAGLCPYLDDPAHATLRIYQPPAFYTLRKTHYDVPLCH